MRKIGKRIVATLLITMLMITNLSVIGIYGKEVYASNLNNQDSKTNHENVEFDTYFINGEEKSYFSKREIGDTNKLITKIKVKEAGYLRNAVIVISGQDKSEANFKISDGFKSEYIAKSNSNSVTLNQIKNETNATIEIPIEFKISENINIAEFQKENNIKLIGTYVDDNGKENAIEKEIKLGLEWTANAEVALEEQILKFIPYDINGKRGLVLQTLVKSGIKDNKMPIEETNIEISVPTINNIKPEQVKVTANSTNATNGDEKGLNFNADNYKYNAETNKLNINVKNSISEEQNIIWKKQTEDSYVITYKYDEKALNSIKEEGVKFIFSLNSEIKIYNNAQKKLLGKFGGEITLKDQISNIVEFSLETIDTQLSKGYIYSNYDTENKIETQYRQKVIANIALSELTDKIVIEQNADNFVKNEGKTKGTTTVSGANYAYYKNILISKDSINKVLGQDGTIRIYSGMTLISEINKDTVLNEQGNIVIDLAGLNINSIKIETSKPITEGKLEFEITKAIKGNIAYSKTQMREFEALQVSYNGKAINEEKSFVEQNISKDIALIEPVSKAELVINKTNLSTVVTNQNVEIKAILKTDSIYNKLFKNPTITLELPSYIENINIKDVKTLFENSENQELKIKSVVQSAKADGTKVIVVELEGTQTKYTINSISGGINVIILADITVNKLTPSKDANIRMNYTNSNVIEKTRTNIETNVTEVQVSFVAPTGVVTTTSISGYKDGGEKLTAVSGTQQIAVIETLTKAKTATFEMSVINNYDNTIDNISVLGRIPFKGNKDISNGQNMGSTMDVKLQTPITVTGIDNSKVTIYYSENGDATKDLKNSANGWTNTPSSIENIKSYLIVINEYAMNKGDNIRFSYNAKIPENLQHNESAYEKYVVYFNNNLESGKIEDKSVSTRTGITTGKGPVLEATINSNINETVEVREGNIIKYGITVKNTGTEKANDVKATINVPRSMTYVIEDKDSLLGYKYVGTADGKAVIDLGTIEPNKSVTKELWLKVDKIAVEDFCKNEEHYIEEKIGELVIDKYHSEEFKHQDSEYKATINIQAIITTSSIANELKTNVVNNNIIKSYFYSVITPLASNEAILKEQGTYKYRLIVRNIRYR